MLLVSILVLVIYHFWSSFIHTLQSWENRNRNFPQATRAKCTQSRTLIPAPPLKVRRRSAWRNQQKRERNHYSKKKHFINTLLHPRTVFNFTGVHEILESCLYAERTWFSCLFSVWLPLTGFNERNVQCKIQYKFCMSCIKLPVACWKWKCSPIYLCFSSYCVYYRNKTVTNSQPGVMLCEKCWI